MSAILVAILEFSKLLFCTKLQRISRENVKKSAHVQSLQRIWITVPEFIASLHDHQQCCQLLRSLARTMQKVPTIPNYVGLTML